MDEVDDVKELFCNISLIKALMQYFPVGDQSKIQDWLTKIQDDDNGLYEIKARNEYSLYLLTSMQNGTLTHPFNKPPPSGKLKTLCRILPDYLYEDLQKQLKVSYCKIRKMLDAESENYEVPELKCKPCNFISEQPRPRKGITASFAVFSNYDDNN